MRALHALRWEGSSAHAKFKELADVMPLAARVQRITLMPDTPGVACVFIGRQNMAARYADKCAVTTGVQIHVEQLLFQELPTLIMIGLEANFIPKNSL